MGLDKRVDGATGGRKARSRRGRRHRFPPGRVKPYHLCRAFRAVVGPGERPERAVPVRRRTPARERRRPPGDYLAPAPPPAWIPSGARPPFSRFPFPWRNPRKTLEDRPIIVGIRVLSEIELMCTRMQRPEAGSPPRVLKGNASKPRIGQSGPRTCGCAWWPLSPRPPFGWRRGVPAAGVPSPSAGRGGPVEGIPPPSDGFMAWGPVGRPPW